MLFRSMAVMLFLDDENLLLWAVLSCVLHELGHWISIWLLGGHVQRLTLTVAGAELSPERQRLFSYREEFIIAAAGPLVSLLLAVSLVYAAAGLGWENGYLFAGMNLAAGVLNLIPILPLDGGRMLAAALSSCHAPRGLRLGLRWAALGAAWLLFLLGFWLFTVGRGNITLLLTAGWLLLGRVSRERGR